MNAGAKGVKILCSGRLGGAEIARREMQKMGSIPLHTLDADVDYAAGPCRDDIRHDWYQGVDIQGRFGEVLEARQQRRRRPFRRDEGPRRRRPATGHQRRPQAGDSRQTDTAAQRSNRLKAEVRREVNS